MSDPLPPFVVSAEYQAAHPTTPAATPLPPPAPIVAKPGIWSSEFWLHVAALILPAVYQAMIGSADPTLMVVAQVAASVYTLARTTYKSVAIMQQLKP